MKEINDQIVVRQNKLTTILESGKMAYPHNYKVKQTVKYITKKFKEMKSDETSIETAGRLLRVNRKGKISFLNIVDDGVHIQLICSRDKTENYMDLKLLDRGDFIGITGHCFITQSGEESIYVSEYKILSKSLRPIPFPKTVKESDGSTVVYDDFSNKENRYRNRSLDLMLNKETRETFIIRTKIISSIREYLNSHDYMEVQTPILQNQYGGANAKPFLTKFNSLDMDVFLRISNELYLKKCIMGGFNKVYEIGKDFRNEGIDRTHNPEFTMIEFYEAYADYKDMMVHFENIFYKTAQKLFGTSTIVYEDREIDLKLPWIRMTFYESIEKLTSLSKDRTTREELERYLIDEDINFDNTESDGELWIKVFEGKVEEKLIQPHIIYDYPKDSTPLCKSHRENPDLVEQFEPYISGWEMGNAYTELNDPVKQRALLNEQVESGRGGDETHLVDETFLEAMEYGMPPTGGVGIGIDRMVMLFTNSKHIKDVILFPLMK